MAGWNGSQGETPKKVESKNGPAVGKGFLALLIVVALAGVVWFLSSDSDKEAKPVEIEKPKPVTTIVEVKPAERQKPMKVEPEKPAFPSPVDPDFQAKYPKTPGHLPLRGGNVVTFAPPAPGCTTTVYTVGGVYLCDSEGNFQKWEPPKLFDNRFENTLEALAMDRALIMTSRHADFTKEEIANYLSTPIQINEDDPPDIVERKAATAAMKDEIRQYIKDGGTFEQYISEIHGVIGTQRQLHREVVKEITTLMKEGDIEGARECRDQMNKYLGEKGFMGVKLPDSWERQLNGTATEEDYE